VSAIHHDSEPDAATAIGMTRATTTIAIHSRRARSRPSLTASVRLPARRSVSMSRTLFTTRIAADSRPTGTDRAKASQTSSSVCTKYEPVTATTPKKRKTNSSPRPS
jgi:hypothetical protein